MALDTDLVSYWKLEESGANTRVDSHGSNDLTAAASALNTANGIIDNAFNGANGSSIDTELAVADNGTLSFSTKFSISTWIFQPDTFGVLPNSSIATKWLYNTQGEWSMQTNAGAGTQLHCLIASALDDGGGNLGTTTGANFVENTWYHIVMVFDGDGATNADRLKVYINNVMDTLSFTGTIPSVMQNGTADFVIGKWPGLNRNWFGYIDETAIWSRALSGAEVTELYNGGAGLEYPFSSGDFTLTADQASFTLTGQATGLKAGRKLTAGQATFTLTGQASGLVAARKLTAAQASFTLTGQAANLFSGDVMSAAVGSFTLTGQAATLRAGRRITMTRGLFTLTGQSVTLTYESEVPPAGPLPEPLPARSPINISHDNRTIEVSKDVRTTYN